MSSADSKPPLSPPYVPYGTFKNFIEKLREHQLPTRIDKSLLPGMSGGSQAALLAGLRSLKLIDDAGKPLPLMEQLRDAAPDQWGAKMREIVRQSYAFFWNDGFDLSRATAAEMNEKLKDKFDLTGSTIDKVVGFFLAAANEAGIELSPHLSKRKASAPSGAPRKRRRMKGAKGNGADDAELPPPPPPPAPEPNAVLQQLLGKFPEFDPSWPDDIKKKWFDGFERFMSGATSQKEKIEK